MKVRGPVEEFLHLETAGGIVLLLVAAAALIWANSPFHDSYHALWDTPIRIAFGERTISFDLHFLINDGLMTIFFLVVGLEIKREMVDGELSDLKRASLPCAAAIGGMLVPALIYFVLNPDPPASGGWGVPMATDIAFAVGILSLLGRRVPAAMRILLLALAIIDDLGAILVIAFFYTSGTDVAGFAVGGLGIVVLLLWRKLGVRPGPLYLIPLIILWIGLFMAHVHPTLAGVIVGLATPVKPWLSEEEFVTLARDAVNDFHQISLRPGHDSFALVQPIRRLLFAGKESLSPVVRGAADMHGWVAFGIMPLFALANAGVTIGGVNFSAPQATHVILGIALGLAVGKPAGILLMSWIVVKLGWATLPRGLRWRSILIIGLAAGIGFTMAIFIAELAFRGNDELLAVAKLSILAATAAAAIAGLGLGRLFLKPVSAEIASKSPSDVERSTEF